MAELIKALLKYKNIISDLGYIDSFLTAIDGNYEKYYYDPQSIPYAYDVNSKDTVVWLKEYLNDEVISELIDIVENDDELPEDTKDRRYNSLLKLQKDVMDWNLTNWTIDEYQQEMAEDKEDDLDEEERDYELRSKYDDYLSGIQNWHHLKFVKGLLELLTVKI